MENKKQTGMKTEQSRTEETVSVYIPSDGTGAFLEGALNGVNFRIPTDKVVEVPKRIARVIAEARRQIPEDRSAVEAYAGVGGRKLG